LQAFAFFVFSVSLAYLPTYLQQNDSFHMSSGEAGLYAGGIIVIAGAFGTIGGGFLADILNRWFAGARILICGLGFLISAPLFAIAITTRDQILFSVFFVLTAMFLTLHSGPSTAATQDVVPAPQRASANAFSLFTAHLLGDVPGPLLVGILAKALDPTGGQHFLNSVAGQDLSMALLWTCTPALVCAGVIGIIGSRFMSADVARAKAVMQA
jgi:MFS family permease